jgi:hypothetical protein
MRRLLILLVLLITTVGVAQKLPKIKGSGIVELMEVSITEPFNAIEVDGDIDVELIQGGENGYSIETDDNLIEVVQFTISDSTLAVSLTHRITKKKKFIVTIKSSDIAVIDLKNEARLESNRTLKGNDLTIVGGNGTKFDLDVEYTNDVAIELYSNAEGELKSKSLNNHIKLDDRASLKMYTVTDSIHINTTDNSRLTLDGSAEAATISCKENAKIMAKEAALKNVDITLSESSDAFINAKETITLYAQDTSVLELYGDPEITVSGLKNKAKILKKE